MASQFEDDDVPPPLYSLPEQVEALHARRQTGAETSSSRSQAPEEEQLRIASTCIVDGSGTYRAQPQQPTTQAPASKPTIKKGFFDSKPAKKAPSSKADTMPMLKGQKQAFGSGPNIPDFLRVEPDIDEKKYKEMKTQLLDALKPNPDSIADIAKNPQLLSAFDDPEVMAAVNDIAQNPQNFKKYQNNKKVTAFYGAMGSMMGQRLESMGAQQQPATKT